MELPDYVTSGATGRSDGSRQLRRVETFGTGAGNFIAHTADHRGAFSPGVYCRSRRRSGSDKGTYPGKTRLYIFHGQSQSGQPGNAAGRRTPDTGHPRTRREVALYCRPRRQSIAGRPSRGLGQIPERGSKLRGSGLPAPSPRNTRTLHPVIRKNHGRFLRRVGT